MCPDAHLVNLEVLALLNKVIDAGRLHWRPTFIIFSAELDIGGGNDKVIDTTAGDLNWLIAP